ncbi:tyrosine-type recombinase/integrase [Streptomyces sp. NPDC012589]|uniref:tyrosine-type recombinase/integrase n=1 Tax=Streptomyces sp. NPDC012589 TaxID=3364839 RepID=UPI00367E9689
MNAHAFQAERALSPTGDPQSTRWVILDPRLAFHREGTDFLTFLHGADRSVNTIRVYAGRLALFLTWCAEHAVDWRTVTLASMARFRFWLEATPGRRGKSRSGATVNATITAVVEYLRYCALHGVIAPEVADRLSQPRYLATPPPDLDAGERGQFRTVRAKAIKSREVEKPYEALSEEQVAAVVAECRTARDRFLVVLMLATGIRIGEALGLRRQDMHFLPDSRALGCSVSGAHVHVRHRRDNENKALAKSRYPRVVPVGGPTVAEYVAYRLDRDAVVEAEANDLVFVNLYQRPLGKAMTYQAAKGMFERLSQQCGFVVRPHMLRHTAATAWVRAGVPIDVVQQLMGHVSAASTAIYLHANEREKREAVERVAAQREVAAR